MNVPEMKGMGIRRLRERVAGVVAPMYWTVYNILWLAGRWIYASLAWIVCVMVWLYIVSITPMVIQWVRANPGAAGALVTLWIATITAVAVYIVLSNLIHRKPPDGEE